MYHVCRCSCIRPYKSGTDGRTGHSQCLALTDDRIRSTVCLACLEWKTPVRRGAFFFVFVFFFLRETFVKSMHLSPRSNLRQYSLRLRSRLDVERFLRANYKRPGCVWKLGSSLTNRAACPAWRKNEQAIVEKKLQRTENKSRMYWNEWNFILE